MTRTHLVEGRLPVLLCRRSVLLLRRRLPLLPGACGVYGCVPRHIAHWPYSRRAGALCWPDCLQTDVVAVATIMACTNRHHHTLLKPEFETTLSIIEPLHVTTGSHDGLLKTALSGELLKIYRFRELTAVMRSQCLLRLLGSNGGEGAPPAAELRGRATAAAAAAAEPTSPAGLQRRPAAAAEPTSAAELRSRPAAAAAAESTTAAKLRGGGGAAARTTAAATAAAAIVGLLLLELPGELLLVGEQGASAAHPVPAAAAKAGRRVVGSLHRSPDRGTVNAGGAKPMAVPASCSLALSRASEVRSSCTHRRATVTAGCSTAGHRPWCLVCRPMTVLHRAAPVPLWSIDIAYVMLLEI